MSWPCPKCGNEIKKGDNFCPSCGYELKNKKKMYQPSITRKLAEYRSYIQILGVIEIAFGIFAVLIVPLMLLFFFIMPVPEIAGISYLSFLPFLLILVSLIVLPYGIFSINFGRKLLSYKESGRTGTMIIGALNLIFIPFGTVFGIAALYILTRPEVEPLFS
ncbi:MAG: zinc-ribbon domain-containing protein [Candidatus Hodarchaeales archaeon]